MILNDKVLRSAIASKLAYAKTVNKARIMPANMQLHGSHCTHKNPDAWIIKNDTTGINAYAWKTGPSSILIAFKGTSTLQDVKAFLNVTPSRFNFRNKMMKVHTGVLEMFHSIEDALNEEILKNLTISANKYITFCGHSLGGALALFAAAYYGNLTHDNIQITCHTFGAPKVGDTEFLQWLEEGTNDIINVVAQGDLVPCLPIVPPFAAGKQVILDNGFIVSSEHGQIFDLPYKVRDPVKRHDLETYIEFIRENTELDKTPKLRKQE